MFSRQNRGNRPGLSPFTPYTALLGLLWLLLVVYIITHPDPVGVIILIVMGVFIVGPMLFMWALIFGRKRWRVGDGISDAYETPAGRNGRYVAGENGPQTGRHAETDEASGEIPDETPKEEENP